MKRAPTRLGYASVILCIAGAVGLLWVLVGNPPAADAVRVLSLFTVAIGALVIWIDQAASKPDV